MLRLTTPVNIICFGNISNNTCLIGWVLSFLLYRLLRNHCEQVLYSYGAPHLLFIINQYKWCRYKRVQMPIICDENKCIDFFLCSFLNAEFKTMLHLKCLKLFLSHIFKSHFYFLWRAQ